MKIIHVTPEVQPYSSTSSISECVASLPMSLAAKKHNITVISPLYSAINIEKHNITSTGLKTWVDAGYKVYEYEIYKTVQANVTYLFFKNDELFNRIGLYATGNFDYSDNDIRFGTFCQAVLNYIKYHDIDVDILHSHDWQCSLIPVYKNMHYSDLKCKTILTLHSVDSLGVFSKFSLETLNLPWDIYNIDFMEYYDSISFVKGGLVSADHLITVSPTFAKELVSNNLDLGLSALFTPHSDKLDGISSGIDPNRWNPEKDKFIAANYSAKDISGKRKCREQLCKEFGFNNDYPIISFISKLTPAKGVELIIDAIADLEKLECNFLIVANNSSDYHAVFKEIAAKTKNVKFTKGYFRDDAHNLIAGSDIAISTSLYEPSALIISIAQVYGVIPVVRATGAAIDSVREAYNQGLAFVFEEFSKTALLVALNKAITLVKSKDYEATVKKIMSIDNSWDKPTKSYEELYNKVLVRGNA